MSQCVTNQPWSDYLPVDFEISKPRTPATLITDQQMPSVHKTTMQRRGCGLRWLGKGRQRLCDRKHDAAGLDLALIWHLLQENPKRQLAVACRWQLDAQSVGRAGLNPHARWRDDSCGAFG